jgi:hypothetical protein
MTIPSPWPTPLTMAAWQGGRCLPGARDVDDRKTQSKLSLQRKDEEKQMTNNGGGLR